jgi:hypothetical protein
MSTYTPEELDRACTAVMTHWGKGALTRSDVEFVKVVLAAVLPAAPVEPAPCKHPEPYDTGRPDGALTCPDCGAVGVEDFPGTTSGAAMSALTISGSPVDAMMPGAALVVGYEDGRLYLGTRHKGLHVHVAPESQTDIEQTWRRGGSPHLFCRGWSRDDICSVVHADAVPVEQPVCEIKGPYYPVGDVDWECRTHGATAVLVDPSRYGAKDLRRSDFRCSVGAPPVEQRHQAVTVCAVCGLPYPCPGSMAPVEQPPTQEKR